MTKNFRIAPGPFPWPGKTAFLMAAFHRMGGKLVADMAVGSGDEDERHRGASWKSGETSQG